MPLAGAIAYGFVWGWLTAQRFAQPLRVWLAAVAAAAVAGEAAFFAGGGAAVGLLLALVAGGALRTWLSWAIVQRAAAP